MTCTFVGNSDVFGIGIRIGYYAQALAIWFSNYFSQHEVRVLRATNNLFLLAMVVAGFTYFANPSRTHVIEAFLLLQVGLVVGMVGITEATRFQSSKYRQVSDERMLLRVGIFAFGSAFNVLFWWKGLDVMLATPCNGVIKQGVGTYACYAWRVSLYGWMRTVMKVQSLFAAMWTAHHHIAFDAGFSLLNQLAMHTRKAFIKSVLSGAKISSNPAGSTTNKSANGARSTPASSTGIEQSRSSSFTKFVGSDTELFREIANAEEYFDSLFAIFTDQIGSQPANKGSFFPRSPFRANSKARARLRCIDTTPYAQCLRGSLQAFFHPPTWQARQIIALYFFKSGQYRASDWGRVLNRLHQFQSGALCSSSGRQISLPGWRYLIIASDIRLFQIPTSKTSSTWLFEATTHLLVILLLILQVELTIAWNHVTGLNSLSALGQLIPFIIGVGGMIKVFWGKVFEIKRGVKVTDVKREGKYERALRLYVERKGKPESREGERGVVKALTF